MTARHLERHVVQQNSYGLFILFDNRQLAAAAMEASGRQPEVAGQVRTSMLIAAALIEGATFFALAICIILATKS